MTKNPLKVKLDNKLTDSKEVEPKNEYVKLCRHIRDIFVNEFDIHSSIADFFAQSLCYYPDDCTVEDWVDLKTSKKHIIETKDINETALKICISGLNINCHLLLCNFCRIECSTYTGVSNIIIDESTMTPKRVDIGTPLLHEVAETFTPDKTNGITNNVIKPIPEYALMHEFSPFGIGGEGDIIHPKRVRTTSDDNDTSSIQKCIRNNRCLDSIRMQKFV